LRGDECRITNKPTKDNVENNIINDSFDSSYSEEISEHLSRVNMDSWYYIYANYVNPTLKNNKDSSINVNENYSKVAKYVTNNSNLENKPEKIKLK